MEYAGPVAKAIRVAVVMATKCLSILTSPFRTLRRRWIGALKGTMAARAGFLMGVPAGAERRWRSIMHAGSCSVPCRRAGGFWAVRAGSPQLTGAKPLDHLFTDRYSDGIVDYFWPRS